MISVLEAIRNVTIAVLLAWMGFSVAPDKDDRGEDTATAPNSSMIGFLPG
ncbi:MAG: hypothetical protein AAFO74_07005 [Pseudomonadota bacterium]